MLKNAFKKGEIIQKRLKRLKNKNIKKTKKGKKC